MKKNPAIGARDDGVSLLLSVSAPASAPRQMFVLPRPKIKLNTNITAKRSAKIFAIPDAVPAIPPKPSTAAITAITRKMIA